MKDELSTDSYKGVRDFYPEDMFTENYIFSVMRETSKSFGYEEYTASILEPAELYIAKTGEEIVNEQTYTFTDRGDRKVTLRPEMTPTVARMIAARQRELTTPIRWFSIPNLFRYEQPQKGRLREHYQLNVDIFGVESLEAEVEVIELAYNIMINFGAKEEDFVIYINNRKVINSLYDSFDLSDDQKYKVSKLIDKKDKIQKSDFEDLLSDVLGEKTEDFVKAISSTESIIEKVGENSESVLKVVNLIKTFEKLGMKNIVFNPLLMRGFDYYTDVVFEVFDTNPENKRSLFGGGRYDDLLSIFGKDKMPAFGFGMGDVTIRDFLATRNLLPNFKSETDLYICRADDTEFGKIAELAKQLRDSGLKVAIDMSGKKIGDQIKKAEKKSIPFILCVGQNELENKKFEVKNIVTGNKETMAIDGIADYIINDTHHIDVVSKE